MRNLAVLLFIVVLLSGCVTATVNTQNNKSLTNTDLSSLAKVVLIPIKVEVKESGIGSLEKLPERSDKATKIVMDELRSAFAANGNIELIDYVPSDDSTQTLLDEHIGLYQRVAGSAENIQYMGPAWKSRSEYDYTVGEGLSFVSEATDADIALFVYGEDIVSSGGKKALAVLAMIGGIGVNPGGIAVLHVGLVDIKTGHLLWSNSSASQGLSLDNNNSVKKALVDILQSSPISKNKG